MLEKLISSLKDRGSLVSTNVLWQIKSIKTTYKDTHSSDILYMGSSCEHVRGNMQTCCGYF